MNIILTKKPTKPSTAKPTPTRVQILKNSANAQTGFPKQHGAYCASLTPCVDASRAYKRVIQAEQSWLLTFLVGLGTALH